MKRVTVCIYLSKADLAALVRLKSGEAVVLSDGVTKAKRFTDHTESIELESTQDVDV
jgi:hypothetical protein